MYYYTSSKFLMVANIRRQAGQILLYELMGISGLT